MLSVTQVIDGRYTIKRRLGIGGMAEVYLAIDESLGREVALKVLNPALAADPAFVERFKREARAVAALNHPNIVAIYNWGEYDGMYYIVMEYVPGGNLKEQLRQVRALPEEDALAIAVLVANALEAAHVRGIVHRDVKPHNILLAPDGRVKVTDFGIAWAAGASQLTATNAVLGTAHYLSPEQVTHHAIDGRTDVYGLGVVLFEMLTGMTPFTGDTLVAVAMKQATETAPSIRTLRPDLSPRTDAIVRTALAKDPGSRFPTAAAMRDALQDARDALLRPLSTQTVSLPSLAAMPPGKPVLPIAGDAAAAMTRPVQMRNAPPPFLPPARRTNNDRIIPLVAVVALLMLFVVGILAGGRLFGRSTITTTATPAGATQIAGGLPPLSPTMTATAPATATRTASTPVAAIIAPTASAPTTPPAMAVATAKPALPVALPTVPLPTMALPVPTATIAPVLAPPTSVPPTAVQPTAVPPTPPMPTATAIPPTATAVPPTAVPAPPMMVVPPQDVADNSTPIGAVRGFYQLVSAHQFDAAASLWSARQQAQYPPASNIAGRFANTSEVSVDMARIVNQNANTATVAVTITEVKQGQSPQRLNGTWQLVRGPSGWLLDQPNF